MSTQQKNIKNLETISNMQNMLNVSLIDMLIPDIKSKKNENVIKMLDVVKDKPDVYLNLLSVAIFHKNKEIVELILDKYLTTEIEDPYLNTQFLYNATLPDKSKGKLTDSKNNYYEEICPYAVMAGIGGDIELFKYLYKKNLINSYNMNNVGIIGLTKRHKNTFCSNIVGACAYYGNDKLLEYILENHRPELDINIITTEKKSKNSKIHFSKEFSGYTPPFLVIGGMANDKKTVEILKIFEEYRSYFDSKDFNDNNIIHIATKEKKLLTLQFLVESLGLKTIINEYNSNSETPYILAQQSKNNEIINFFDSYLKEDEDVVKKNMEELINDDNKRKNKKKNKKQKNKKDNFHMLNSNEYEETLAPVEEKIENKKEDAKNKEENNEDINEENIDEEEENEEIEKEKDNKKDRYHDYYDYYRDDNKKFNSTKNNYKVGKKYEKNEEYNRYNTYTYDKYNNYNNNKYYNDNKYKDKYKKNNNNYGYDYDYNNINKDYSYNYNYNKGKYYNNNDYYNQKENWDYKKGKRGKYNNLANKSNKEIYSNKYKGKGYEVEIDTTKYIEKEKEINREDNKIQTDIKEEAIDIGKEKQNNDEDKKNISNSNFNKKENDVEQKEEIKNIEEEEEEDYSYSEEDFLSHHSEKKEEKKIKASEYDELYKKYLEKERMVNNLEKEKTELNKCIQKIYLDNNKKNITNEEQNIKSLLDLTNNELEKKDKIISKLKNEAKMADLSDINNFQKDKLKEYKNFYRKNLKIINDTLKLFEKV